MEHRSKTTTGSVVGIALALLLAAAAHGQRIQFEVRHERALKDHPGVVTFDDTGVQYQQVLTARQQAKAAKRKKAPKLESVRWEYGDLQQLWLSAEKLVLVTYRDRKWFLGVDKEFEFYFVKKDQPVAAVYQLLQGKLDQRFVAALAEPDVATAWEIPVKLLGTIQGSEGTLRVADDRIVYETSRKGHSRTWRLEDIENVSTSGPFELTITTYERSIAHYGSRRGFQFQVKRRLDPGRVDALWKRLHRDKGLDFLTAIEARKPAGQ